MGQEVNMYYRFTNDNEPTDEQLEFLMKEVGENVRRENLNMQSTIMENIMKEYAKLKEKRPNL